MLNIVKNKETPLVNGPVIRSSVLDRVQAFLPTMAAANSALLERQKAEGEGCCDIENTEDTAQDQVIEMNLALFERDDEDDDSDISSCSDSDSSDCSCDEMPTHGGPVTPETMRLPAAKGAKKSKRRSRGQEKDKPLIEEMVSEGSAKVHGNERTMAVETEAVEISENNTVEDNSDKINTDALNMNGDSKAQMQENGETVSGSDQVHRC